MNLKTEFNFFLILEELKEDSTAFLQKDQQEQAAFFFNKDNKLDFYFLWNFLLSGYNLLFRFLL